MMESIGDDGELGKALGKLSLVRERQCKMREKPESAKRQKMRGGESGSRSVVIIKIHVNCYNTYTATIPTSCYSTYELLQYIWGALVRG